MFYLPSRDRKGRQAFTLIELLIVVAIIAILAAIAVPNFLEAQVRAKVSRAKADMRSMATAIESYVVDNNKLPRSYRPSDPPWNRTVINSAFTTPIAYITSVFPDAFNLVEANPLNRVIVFWGANGPNAKDDAGNLLGQLDSISASTRATFFQNYPNFYNPTADAFQNSRSWLLFSLGPDMKYAVTSPYPSPLVDYDPTNGTVSFGDVIRWNS